MIKTSIPVVFMVVWGVKKMVFVDLKCSLENFRRFLILSCCRSFIPREYFEDKKIFPERVCEKGLIYTEAEDKVTLKKIRDIQFVKVENIVGVIYNSKSGSTRLRWEHQTDEKGKLVGEASVNAVVKLVEAGIITEEMFKRKTKN